MNVILKRSSLVERVLAKIGRFFSEPNYFRRFLQRRGYILKRAAGLTVMLFLVHFWPEQVYRFSTRKLLPGKDERYRKLEKLAFPYDIVESRTSIDLPTFSTINLVLRGTSATSIPLETLSGPIVLASFWPKALIDRTRHYQGKTSEEFEELECYFLHHDSNAIQQLLSTDRRVLWDENCYVDETGNLRPQDSNWQTKWYEEMLVSPFCKRVSILYNAEKNLNRLRPPTGSGLSAIVTCSFLAETVNVYGWDFYLEHSPEEMSYWQLLFSMYKKRRFSMSTGDKRIADRRLDWAINHLESAVYNYYYGYHWSKLKNINIHGRLGELKSHKKLIDKLERVLFNR